MIVSKALINQIEDRIDIVELVGSYISLQPKGRKWWANCPFHHEKSPSFSVSTERNNYYCFGCKKGGGCFQFYMEMEGVSFSQAVKDLAARVGIDIKPDREEVQEEIAQKKSLLELYQKLTGSFEYLLWHSARGRIALEYLFQRGISEESLKKFRVGYSMAGYYELYQFLAKRGYSDNFLRISGLFSQKNLQYSLLKDRIIFPLINSSGQVVAYSGRSMPDANADTPKYINSPETIIFSKRKELFGIWQAKTSLRAKEEFILCEGATDVIALHQLGYDYAVASLGTAFTREQLELLKRFTKKGLLLMDGDLAGQKAIYQAALLCEELEITSLRATRIPANKDPSECLEYAQVDLLTKSINNATIYFDFLLQDTFKNIPKDDIDKRLEASSKIFAYINAIVSSGRSETYLRMLAHKLRISEESVQCEYKRFLQGYNHSAVTMGVSNVEVAFYQTDKEAVLELLGACLMHGSLYEKYRNNLELIDFDKLHLKEVHQYLEHTPSSFVSMDDFFIKYMPDLSLKETLERKRLSAGVIDENWYDRAKKAMLRIFLQEFKYKQTIFLQELAKTKGASDVALVGELQREVNDLGVELQRVMGGYDG